MGKEIVYQVGRNSCDCWEQDRKGVFEEKKKSLGIRFLTVYFIVNNSLLFVVTKNDAIVSVTSLSSVGSGRR